MLEEGVYLAPSQVRVLVCACNCALHPTVAETDNTLVWFAFPHALILFFYALAVRGRLHLSSPHRGGHHKDSGGRQACVCTTLSVLACFRTNAFQGTCALTERPWAP